MWKLSLSPCITAWLFNRCQSIMLNFKLNIQNIYIIPLQTKLKTSKIYIFKLHSHCVKLEDMDKMLFLLESKWPFHVVISKGRLINRNLLGYHSCFLPTLPQRCIGNCEEYTCAFWKQELIGIIFHVNNTSDRKHSPFHYYLSRTLIISEQLNIHHFCLLWL